VIKSEENTGMLNLISKLSLPRMTIWRYLNILKNEGLIEYRGSKKTGRYILTQKMKKETEINRYENTL
jgi:DNA-binding IclR family transcriptional regulator